jgi:hypothetical protein
MCCKNRYAIHDHYGIKLDQDLNDHRANPVINRSEIRGTAIAKMHMLYMDILPKRSIDPQDRDKTIAVAKMHMLCNGLFIDAIG